MLKNGFYNTLAGIAKFGLGILTVPILIRLLGVENYGIWSLASSVIGLVALAEAGLATTTTVFVAKDLGEDNAESLAETLLITVSAMFFLATLAAIILGIGAEAIAPLFPKLSQTQQTTVAAAFRLGGIVVWTRLMQQSFVGILQAYQRYAAISIIKTTEGIILSLGMILLALSQGGVLALVQWQVTIGCLSLLIYAALLKSTISKLLFKVQWNSQKVIHVFRYGSMMWLTSLGSALFSRGDRIIVGNILGAQGLGIYAVITDIVVQINQISALPVQPLLPQLSRLLSQGQQHAVKDAIAKCLTINALVSFGLGLTILTFAPEIDSFLIEANHSHSSLLRLATLIYAVYSVNAVGYYSLLGLDRVTICAFWQMAAGGLALGSILLGSQLFGLQGAILGNLAYWILSMITFYAMKYLSIPTKDWAGWLAFPILWFLTSSALNIALSTPFIRLTVFTLELIILVYYYEYRSHHAMSAKLKSFLPYSSR